MTTKEIFQPESVRKVMRAVYDWQVKNQTRYVVRRTGRLRFLKDTDWERGVFWSAVSRAWQETGDQAYFDGVANYSLHTGFRPGPNARFADDHMCIQAYMDIYPEFNHPEILDYTRKALDIMVDEPKPGREDWYWCDSLYMAPPSFVAFGAVTGEQKYVDYADKGFWDALEFLWDKDTNLVYRDHRYIPNEHDTELREANGEKVFWARGIGWVLAAVPNILRYLPADYPTRDKYLETFRTLAKAVIPFQHEDGFWRVSFLDPVTFPNPESSATSLFCYGLAWGINNGQLDRETYLPVVEKAWEALVSAVHPNGMLGWVQLPAFNPREVKFEDNIDYGPAAFLLAGSEVQKLYN